ncbi:MAG: HEAT repeat domain-containing protein [Planctomycetes bacterium]|nr:HEAT repeat domain-containing protein [Planctomycetota bacterium]MBI3844324.1 HEAT repeat domain-containing protein [Planctomycetota bacterium]
MTRCADCEVELVATLRSASAESAAEERPHNAFTLYATSEELADRLARALERADCPNIRGKQPVEVKGRQTWSVSIPMEFTSHVMSSLGIDPDSVEESDDGSWVLVAPVERERAPDAFESPLLGESNAAILRRGGAVIPELLEIVWKASESEQRRAAELLAELGVAGAQALTEIARKAVIEGERMRLHAITFGLGNVHEYRPDEAFSPFLEDANSTTRALAAMVIGRTGSETSIRLLVPLLEDPEVEVREEAIEGLYHITHDDLGFEADAPAAERAAAVAKWKSRE